MKNKKKKSHRRASLYILCLLFIVAAGVLLYHWGGVSNWDWKNQSETESTAALSQAQGSQKNATVSAAQAESRSTGFFYAQLSEAEKTAYTRLLKALPAFEEKIRIPDLDSEAAGRVFHAVIFDNPTFFMLDLKFSISSSALGTYFLPTYRMDKSTYEAKLRALEAVVSDYIGQIPPGADDYTKELYLHDRLITSCNYNLSEDLEESTAYGALVNNKASCEGYSRAMLLLLERVGFDCYIVTGVATNSAGETQGHAWNHVLVDGEWYQLDATWDDPTDSDSSGGNLSRVWFNFTDADAAAGSTHTADKGYIYSECNASQANYFVRSGLYFTSFGSAEESRVAEAIADAVIAGEAAIELKLSSASIYDTAVKRLFDEQRIYRILSNARLSAGDELSAKKVGVVKSPGQQILRLIPSVDD